MKYKRFIFVVANDGRTIYFSKSVRSNTIKFGAALRSSSTRFVFVNNKLFLWKTLWIRITARYACSLRLPFEKSWPPQAPCTPNACRRTHRRTQQGTRAYIYKYE